VTSDVPSVLVLAPRGRDAELMVALLAKHGLPAVACADANALIGQIGDDAGCALLTQEALDSTLQLRLAQALSVQPPWSDFPLIALVNAQTSDASQLLALELGNVTALERPLAPHTLLSAVRAALRARRRQFEARAAIQQRDQFLAMLGHELRNPLGAIMLAAQLAREDADQAQLVKRLGMIERHSNVLGRLVDDLLDVARVTTGKVRLRREAVDIDATIRGCVATLGERATNHGITLKLAATSGAVIEGDAVRIEQVINNLVANAIKYSQAERSVFLSSAIEGTHCVIRVRDEGIGIAPEMQKRVFELFAQADSSLERSEGGMGIGLTLVDRLVRLHGGRVELHSEGLGHGSELLVRLPIGSPPGNSQPTLVMPSEPDCGLRVVVVEDNADLRDLTSDLLEVLGCQVELADDGRLGLETILRSKPDLALVDIGLPVLDGYEVAREVRAKLGSSVWLVAVSGYGLDRDREQSKEAGFDRHITKPLDTNTLRDVIDQARVESARAARPGAP
jgi:signal transduction histidine kinase/ActR/RegA family two-component response regulator